MDKRALIIFTVLLAVSYFAGRYSAPEKIKIVTKVEVHEIEKSREEKSGEKIEVTTQIIRPDGTKISRTRLEARHESHKEDDKDTSSKTVVDKEITNRRGVVVSALVGIGLTELLKGPMYGVSVQKQVIGPINMGAFGFNDGRVGISLGLEF